MPTQSLVEAGDEPAPEPIDRQLLVLGGVLLVGAMAALLDTTMVSVAIADMAAAFDAPVARVQWVSAAYLLSMAVAIPAMGWLVDCFGARRVWLGALWTFLVGSVLCGAAWSLESLVAFRVVKGLGAGLVLPLVQAVLAEAAGPRRFGRVMALVGIPGQLAPVLGPVIGGFVLSSVGWRWIFVGNVPVVALALALARRHLRTPAGRGGARLDAVGLALAAAGLAALLYGLSTAGQRAGLGGGVAAILAAGAVLLVLFALHAARARDRALVDLRLFRIAAFRAAAASLFLFGASLYGPMLLLPLLYQEVRGATAAEVGWLLAPQGAGTMAVLWLAGRATDRAGPRPVAVAGVVLAALATLPFCGGATATGSPLLAASLVVRGVGLGAAGVAVLGAGYHGVAAAAIPRATSLLNVTQRVGASFGTALLAVVLQRGLDAAARPSEVAGAYAGAFRWSVALSLVALVPALALPRRRGAATAGPGGGGPRGRPAPMRT